ncbi:MAG: hypothetical protein QXF61_11480 [Nitrososphaeria archaeon]
MRQGEERTKMMIGVVSDISANGCKVNGKFYKFFKSPDNQYDFAHLKEHNIYELMVLDDTYIVSYRLLHSNNLEKDKDKNDDTTYLRNKHDEIELLSDVVMINRSSEEKRYSVSIVEKSIKHAIDLIDLVVKYHSKKDNSNENINIVNSITIGLNGEILFMNSVNFNMLVLSFIKIYEKYSYSE